jgi:hypothetical protein
MANHTEQPKWMVMNASAWPLSPGGGGGLECEASPRQPQAEEAGRRHGLIVGQGTQAGLRCMRPMALKTKVLDHVQDA